jgi:hypothetical protein
MGLLSLLKATAIKATDLVNSSYDPFDEFTRPILRRTSMTLGGKSAAFDQQLRANFILPNGVFNYRLVYDGEPLDLGDQCLWHGICTATYAWKYAVTHDPADAATLRDLLTAMAVHHYGPNLWLIRGITPDKSRFADDASNDSLTGHLAGLWFGWKYGDAACQVIASSILKCTAEELLENNDSLMRQDGTPTTYGKLVDGWKTDPLRLTLALGVYAAAGYTLKDGRFADRYLKLYNTYREIVGFPKVNLLWWGKEYDTPRAAMHLCVLADLFQTPCETSDRVRYGLKRIWEMEHKTADPYLFGLAAKHGCVRSEEIPRVMSRLHEYEVEERGTQLERLNSKDAAYWKDHGVKFFMWGGHLRASQPLPFWKIGSQDFFPQRNLFSVDNYAGSTDARLKYAGLDFLASYWLGRLNGFIKDTD